MQLEFGYGSGVQTVELPQENLLGVLHAAPILVGRECYETVRCIDSDAADCIHLGDTAHGTPVDITRAVAEADFRICLGNIEFHFLTGCSPRRPRIPLWSASPAISSWADTRQPLSRWCWRRRPSIWSRKWTTTLSAASSSSQSPLLRRRWTPPSGNTAPPPPSSPCPTAAQHCRICRTQAPITAGHNKLKSSRSQMRPAAFSDNMQVQAQTLRPM